jgi:hypothetical protein
MRIYLILIALVSLDLCMGCSKTEPGAANSTSQEDKRTVASDSKVKMDLLARLHFIGSEGVFADTNSARLKEIAELPATAELRDQTLQKLATAPFRFLEQRIAEKTNDHATLVRPLVDDLLRAELYMEMRGVTNPAPELMLAIRLNAERAELWRTNLSTILTSWTGLPIKEIVVGNFKGWEMKKHKEPNLIRFLRAGNWVLFGWGQDELLLQPGMIEKIKSQGRPVAEAKDHWLDAWVDWPSLALRHTNLAAFKLPKTEITLTTTKDYIRPKVTMEFSEPLNLALQPWNVPTNIIHDPLISFTALRGATPWLKEIPMVKELNVEQIPDQFFIWAMKQIPFETCIVAPVQNGTNFMAQHAPQLMSLANTNLQRRSMGEVRWQTNENRLLWTGMPMLSPYLELVTEPSGEYIKAGIFPSPPRKTPPPAELLNELTGHTNLVYYDWEITGERLGQWRAISDFGWMISGEMLAGSDAPTQKWLEAVAPKLGNCGTTVTVTGLNELTLIRNSPIGLTAFELTMLKRWLDTPKFPLGFTYPRERPNLLKKKVVMPTP